MAVADAFGYNASIGWGEESTYSTAVARTKFMEFITESLKKTVERQEAPSVRSLSERRRQNFLIAVAGDMEFEGIYEALEKILKHLFGAVATTGPTDTTVFTHQFTFADALPPGLSIEVFRGDNSDSESGAADSAHLYDGCKVASATFKFAPNEALRITFTIVGANEVFVAKTAVVFPDLSGALLIKGHHVSCEFDDVATLIREAELTIDNGLDTGKRVMGSQEIAQPVRNTRRKVTGKMVADWGDKTVYNKFVNGTAVKLELIAQSASFVAGSASTPYRFAFTLPSIRFDGETPAVSSVGQVLQPLPFFALATGTGTSDSIYLDIKNALTAV